MIIYLETYVHRSSDVVIRNFNKDLFNALNPPFPPVKVKEFGGSSVGEKLHLEFNFIFFKQDWVGEITESYREEDDSFMTFTDEGKKLPFFLKSWKHKHTVKSSGEGALIIDHIHYRTPFLLFDYLMYPFMYLQFLYRNPMYKRYFRQLK